MLQKPLHLCLFGLLCLCMPFSATAERAALPWVDAGWSQMQNDNMNAALNAWQRGINNLPDKQLLGFLGAFSSLDNAVDTIKRAGKNENVFIVQSYGKNKLYYYALTAQPFTEDLAIRQVEMLFLKERLGIHGKLLANEARKFKQGYVADIPQIVHNKPSKKAAQEQQQIIAVADESFTINSFEVKGNKRVSTDTILLSLRDYYGPEKSPSEFKNIRRQIIDIYNMERVYNVKVNTPRFIEEDTVLISITEL